MFSIAIVEDHPVFKEALKQLLSRVTERISVTESSSFDELKRHLEANPRTDLILLDLSIPGAEGMSALAFVRYHYPETRVAVISGHEDAGTVRKAIDLGAHSYIPKSLALEPLLAALQTVVEGGSYRPKFDPSNVPPDAQERLAQKVTALTPQKRRILYGLAEGKLNKQIGYDLGLSEGTVKNHVTAILRHLGMRRRTEVVAAMQQLLAAENESFDADQGHTAA